MNKIDLNLYSRQICTYGIDIMEKIINLKILVVGLRGLGSFSRSKTINNL